MNIHSTKYCLLTDEELLKEYEKLLELKKKSNSCAGCVRKYKNAIFLIKGEINKRNKEHESLLQPR